MGAMASLITSLTSVYSTVHSGADQTKKPAPRHWPLCGEFTGGDRWIPRTNGQSRGKCFYLMRSSELCLAVIRYWSVLPLSLLVASQLLRKAYDCPRASEIRLTNMGQCITWIHQERWYIQAKQSIIKLCVYFVEHIVMPNDKNEWQKLASHDENVGANRP